MLELMFDGTLGIWTLRDTLSTAYPLLLSNGVRYMRGHPEYNNGVVISDTTGEYKYTMMNKDNAFMDIIQYDYGVHSIVLRPVDCIFEEINAIINLGNLNINNHLNKRFHEVQLEFTNINSNKIDMAYSFKIDGKQQQTSEDISLVVDNMVMIQNNKMDFETLGVSQNTNFMNFTLDLSSFPIAEKIVTKVAANGRGRIPSLIVSLNINNDFEIFRFLFIYKEQTTRRVT